MSWSVDILDVATVSLALFDAASAGQYYVEGDLIGFILFTGLAVLLGALALFSHSFDVKQERRVAESLEYEVETSDEILETVDEYLKRVHALSETLVGVLDVDPVPVELESNEAGEVVVVDLREQGGSAGMA